MSNNAYNWRLALPYTENLPLDYMTKQIQVPRASARVNNWFNQETKEKRGNDNTI